MLPTITTPKTGINVVDKYSGLVGGNPWVSGALAYHGYARNGSLLWGAVWGLLVPNIIGLPLALIQGFAKTK